MLCRMGPRRRPKGTRGAGQFAPKPVPDPAPSPPASLRDASLSESQREADAPSLLRDVDRGGDGSGGADHKQDGTERADRYLEELVKEVGQPSPQAVAEAEALWDRIERARTARAVG